MFSLIISSWRQSANSAHYYSVWMETCLKVIDVMMSFTFVFRGIRKHKGQDLGGWLDERICGIISLSTIFICNLIINEEP